MCLNIMVLFVPKAKWLHFIYRGPESILKSSGKGGECQLLNFLTQLQKERIFNKGSTNIYLCTTLSSSTGKNKYLIIVNALIIIIKQV